MKILKVTNEQGCNGCLLCVYEAQRQLKKVGLEDSPIRIFKNEDGVSFKVVLDPSINNQSLQPIKTICPKNVFEISEIQKDEDIRTF